MYSARLGIKEAISEFTKLEGSTIFLFKICKRKVVPVKAIKAYGGVEVHK